MKIVNNAVEEKTGDILIGDFSGDYYIVLYDTSQILKLKTLDIYNRKDVKATPTSIHKENITITFN